MDVEKFKKLIEEREYEASWERRDENDIEIERIWEELTNILSENINDTINYLKTDCTLEEFEWISEVFYEIVDKTQSQEFIKCLYEVEKKFHGQYECNILGNIEFAKQYLR